MPGKKKEWRLILGGRSNVEWQQNGNFIGRLVFRARASLDLWPQLPSSTASDSSRMSRSNKGSIGKRTSSLKQAFGCRAPLQDRADSTRRNLHNVTFATRVRALAKSLARVAESVVSLWSSFTRARKRRQVLVNTGISSRRGRRRQWHAQSPQVRSIPRFQDLYFNSRLWNSSRYNTILIQEKNHTTIWEILNKYSCKTAVLSLTIL